MKLRKVRRPPRRDWFLVLNRPGGERCDWFDGRAYPSEASAAAAASDANGRRNREKYGTVTYDFVDREESVSYVGRIAI